MPNKKATIRYRRADNGHFTTEKYAKRYPKKTIKETIKVVPQKKTPAKKIK